MKIISKEDWQNEQVEIINETGKLADICKTINEVLSSHVKSEYLLDEEIQVDLDDMNWPTLEEFIDLTEMIEEAGYQYVTLMKPKEEYLSLRIGVNSEWLTSKRRHNKTFYELSSLLDPREE
jgi:hypothetical protein